MQQIDFQTIPLLKDLDRIDRASLIPRLRRVEKKAGEPVVRQGGRGDSLYIILSGTALVSRQSDSGIRSDVAILGAGECFGELALLAGTPRTADVTAMTDLVLVQLSRKGFERLFRSNPSVSTNLSIVLAQRFSKDPTGFEKGRNLGEESTGTVLSNAEHLPTSLISRGGMAIRGLFAQSSTIALCATVLICIATGMLLSSNGISRPHWLLSILLLGATILWSMDVFSYHAVAVALPLLAVLFKVALPEQAFSGFSSPSWFLVLGIFAITAAISRTGLMYRLVLIIVKRFPPRYSSQAFALAFSGLLLTPVIPSSNGRAALAGPLAVTICETLRFRKGSPGAIGIAMACLLGFGHMSFMFMNGTATCFLALGLLPHEVVRSVTWMSWLITALPLGLVYFLTSFGCLVFLYRPRQEGQLRGRIIDAQLKALGPMTRHEMLSLATVIVALASFASQSLHNVNGAWIAMLSFLILFGSGVLNENSVRSDIDWNFLISFGALLGFGTVMSGSGLTALAAEKVRPLVIGVSGSPYLFLPAISVATHLARFALPLPAMLLVGILTLVPISSAIGIHPFVIALVLLVSVNPWIAPYQNSIYLNMLESTEGKIFSHNQVRIMAVLQVGAVILAILATIPWWQHTGLIP